MSTAGSTHAPTTRLAHQAHAGSWVLFIRSSTYQRCRGRANYAPSEDMLGTSPRPTASEDSCLGCRGKRVGFYVVSILLLRRSRTHLIERRDSIRSRSLQAKPFRH